MQEIQLNELEIELFETLKKTLNEHSLKTTLRVAGGWVRDKLLGLESHDIDISLDDMTGECFANLFSASAGASSIGKIKANPDASKHLETACVRFKGIELDFVNLRAEDYTADSRIPSIKIGTPLEDALRRDLTINSMFFNINEGKIEDLTSHGRQDLTNRIARTPLNPMTTFLDDPLRVLRTVRFASRFNLTMTEEVSSAITNDQVQQMLKHKISRERVYKEFSLMIKGVNHMQSLRYLHQFNLLQIVFHVPEDFPNLLEKGAELMFKISRPKSDSNLILYSSALLVFYSLDGDFKVKRKKRDVEVSELVCEELKMTNQEITSISNIVSTCKQMIQVLQNFDILLLAELLRKLKENWRLSLIIAAHVSSESPLNSIQELEAFVEFHRLGALWLEKPLINVSHIQGDEIKKLLNVEGKSVGNYIQACLNWQVLHREATRDDLIAYLKTYKPY